MTEENGEDDHRNNGHATAAEERAYQLLGAIEILSFTANPPRPTPFETTTLSWSVKLPPEEHRIVSITVEGQTSQGTTGKAIVTPYATKVYGMSAATIVPRPIATLEVRIDDSNCKALTYSATQLADQIKDGITQAFQGSSDFANANVKVAAIDDTILISVPYGGSKITAQLYVGWQGMPPQVSVQVVNVDVEGGDPSTVANVLSLGLASDIADEVKSIVKIFVRLIAETLIAPAIAEQISALVQSFAAMFKQTDPQKRTYSLTSLTLTGEFLMFTVCPLPTPSSQQVRMPVEAPIKDEH